MFKSVISTILLSQVFLACRSGPSTSTLESDFALTFTNVGMSFSTLKAIEKNDFTKAYSANLIILKSNLIHAEKLTLHSGISSENRRLLSSLSRLILTYVENNRGRLSEDPSSDSMALQIVNVLLRTLTDVDRLGRAKELRSFFDSKFVEERRRIEWMRE